LLEQAKLIGDRPIFHDFTLLKAPKNEGHDLHYFSRGRHSTIEPQMRPTKHDAHDHFVIKGDLFLDTGLHIREPGEPVRGIPFWPGWSHSLAVGAKICGEEVIGEVERLRWRTWHGKAKDARITLKRLRTFLPALERGPVRKLRRALRAVDRYLRSQGAWLVNYAERHRAGLRVGTSITEGTANFLVNRRMAKSQQMRWTRRGADLLLQVRCAVYNGALGSGFGQLFDPDPSPGLQWAEAA